MSWSRATRLQAAIARDKLRGGPGLLPEFFPEEGLEKGFGWRMRQAAFDIINGERSSGSDEVNKIVTYSNYIPLLI